MGVGVGVGQVSVQGLHCFNFFGLRNPSLRDPIGLDLFSERWQSTLREPSVLDLFISERWQSTLFQISLV